MADGRLLFDTKLNTSGFTDGLKGLGSLASKASGLLAKGFIAAGAGVKTLGIAAVKTGMEFEAQMSRVQAISGATGDELKGLNALAIKLGADTAFSAKEAADGMENLASAGFNTNEIMAAMPGLLDLAAVSGGDVAQASEVAASSLRAFGLDASQAGHLADVFARAAADTNAEVADMGEAMKYVAPVAKAMGQSVEETAAAIGIMSDAGIKGSQAGTTLRGAFSRLVKPTKKMYETMDELGLSFFDAQGNMKPLNGIIAELQAGTKGLTQEQKNQALVTLFGQESLSGMLALVDAGPDKLNALTDSLINSDGAAKEMAKTMQNNVASNIEQLGGSLETLKIKIFQSVNEPLNNITNKLTEYVNAMGDAFSGIDEKTQEYMRRTGQSAEELGISAAQAKGGLEGLAMVMGDMLSEGLVALLNALPQVANLGVSLVTTLANSITTNLPQISSSVGGLVNILLQGVLDILPQLFVAGIQIISSLAQSIAENLPTLIPVFITGLQNVVNAIITYLPQFLIAAGQIIQTLVLGLVQSIPILIPAIIQILTSIGQLIIDNLPMLLEAGMQIITGLAQGLLEAIPLLIPQITEILLTIVNFFAENIQTIIDLGIQVIMALANGLIEALPQIIPALLQLILAIVNGIVENLPALIDGAIAIIDGLIQFIIENLPLIIDMTIQIIMAIVEGLLNNIDRLVDAGIKLVFGIIDGLINNLPALIVAAIKLITALFGALVDSIPRLIDAGFKLIGGLIQGIVSRIPQLIAAGLQLILGLVGAIVGLIGQFLAYGVKVVTSILSGILKTAGSLISGVVGLVKNVLSAFSNGFRGIVDIGANLIRGLWNGISSVKDWIMGKIGGFVDGIVGGIKGFFGIHSPSKVMEKEIGKFMPPGIAIGFDKSMPGLEKDVKNQLSGLTDTMQKTVDAETNLTAGKIAANSNVYLPNPYDRKQNKNGSTAMITGDIHTTVELDGRSVGYSTSKYSSEEKALDEKRRTY